MKKARKAFALMLAILLTATLFSACGGSSTPPSTAAEQPAAPAAPAADTPAADAPAGAYADYSGGFSNQVTIKIPVYDRAFEGWNVTDNYYTRWMQREFGDKYNVNLEYVAIGRSTEVADYMAMLAAGSAPDIIFHYDMPQAVNYYGEGAMQSLNLDEIAYYAPEYWAKMGDAIKDYGQMDGQNVFFFAEREAIYYNYVHLIRKDWIDAVGGKMPTNREELVALAQQWKDAGLGKIGTDLKNKSFTYYNDFIGASVNEKDFALYSDLNVAPLTWEASKNYLKQLNYEFNNGLLDPEFYLRDDDAKWKAEFVAGKVGTYSFYINSSTDVISSLVATDSKAEVAALDPRVFAPTGNTYYYKYPPYGMIMGINSKTSDEQRAAVWMFLEWMNKPENLFYLQNGVEGENYTLDADGLAIPVADFDGESKRSNNNNKDYWCLVAEVAHYDTEDKSFKANRANLAPAGYEYLVDDAYNYDKQIAPNGLINTIFTKTVESSSEYAGDLNALWQELYVKCITVSEADFEATYEKACEDYLKAGYQKIIDEKQGLLNEGAYK